MKTAPDNCPFCESPIMVHGGNLLRSEDGGFATYECKSSRDVQWSDPQWSRSGQTEVCRIREIMLLGRQLNVANKRIKRLEEWKESALEVEREWDANAIATLLGAKLGESQRKVIQREVPLLLERIKRLEKSSQQLKSLNNKICEINLKVSQERHDSNVRIKQLEQENDALRADLLLWNEKEGKL